MAFGRVNIGGGSLDYLPVEGISAEKALCIFNAISSGQTMPFYDGKYVYRLWTNTTCTTVYLAIYNKDGTLYKQLSISVTPPSSPQGWVNAVYVGLKPDDTNIICFICSGDDRYTPNYGYTYNKTTEQLEAVSDYFFETTSYKHVDWNRMYVVTNYSDGDTLRFFDFKNRANDFQLDWSTLYPDYIAGDTNLYQDPDNPSYFWIAYHDNVSGTPKISKITSSGDILETITVSGVIFNSYITSRHHGVIYMDNTYFYVRTNSRVHKIRRSDGVSESSYTTLDYDSPVPVKYGYFWSWEKSGSGDYLEIFDTNLNQCLFEMLIYTGYVRTFAVYPTEYKGNPYFYIGTYISMSVPFTEVYTTLLSLK